MQAVKLTTEWIVVGLVGLIGLVIVYQMFVGKIDLAKLISESDGKGSMSRLQFLIFTFVIAGSFFLITISKNPPAFPTKIPGEVLALLGISGGSYVLGKGIQTSKDTQIAKQNAEKDAQIAKQNAEKDTETARQNALVERERILSAERSRLPAGSAVALPTVLARPIVTLKTREPGRRVLSHSMGGPADTALAGYRGVPVRLARLRGRASGGGPG